jgi:AAA15 family ATPase/GTPase
MFRSLAISNFRGFQDLRVVELDRQQGKLLVVDPRVKAVFELAPGGKLTRWMMKMTHW